MKINFYWPKINGITSYFDGIQEDLKSEPGEVNVVYIENISDWNGLDVALTLNPGNVPLIMCCFYPKDLLSEEESYLKFYSLMAKNRVVFGRIPHEVYTSNQILEKYREALSKKGVENILSVEINNVFSFEKKIGQIQHNVQYYFGKDTAEAKERVAAAVSEARKLGVEGSESEIALQIENFKHTPKNSILKGKYFPGIFCDVEGTLLVNNEVNIEILNTLKNLSFEKPITLWTGGDVEEIRKNLIKNNIFWSLFSKSDFTGAEIEIAYDDEDQTVFFEKYGVRVREYKKIIS